MVTKKEEPWFQDTQLLVFIFLTFFTLVMYEFLGITPFMWVLTALLPLVALYVLLLWVEGKSPFSQTLFVTRNC